MKQYKLWDIIGIVNGDVILIDLLSIVARSTIYPTKLRSIILESFINCLRLFYNIHSIRSGRLLRTEIDLVGDYLASPIRDKGLKVLYNFYRKIKDINIEVDENLCDKDGSSVITLVNTFVPLFIDFAREFEKYKVPEENAFEDYFVKIGRPYCNLEGIETIKNIVKKSSRLSELLHNISFFYKYNLDTREGETSCSNSSTQGNTNKSEKTDVPKSRYRVRPGSKGDIFRRKSLESPVVKKNLRSLSARIQRVLAEAIIHVNNTLNKKSYDFNNFDFVKADIKDFGRTVDTTYTVKKLQGLYLYKLVTGQLQRLDSSEPVKKSLHILLDESGSMRHGYKIGLANLIFSHVYYLMSADPSLEVYVHKFITDIYETVDLRNKSLYLSRSGGNTDIEESLKTASKIIRNTGNVSNTSIVIINDGEDVIDPNFRSPCRTYVLALGQNNPDLKKVSEKSGGIYSLLKPKQDE